MLNWTAAQRNAVIASIASWMLDATDFFLLVFVFSNIADSFDTTVQMMSYAVTLTLATRPVGALLFGRAAEKWGRKPVLIVNICLFSLFELGSGLSPGLISLFVIRGFYGIAMGGVWGVASALALETVPERSRGLVSGAFQAGYPAGYLIASVVYGALFSVIGWRGLFLIGILPALLAVFVYFKVEESPTWTSAKQTGRSNQSLWPIIRKSWKFVAFAIVIMMAFNFFSHGTQDVYPTFLKVQHGLGSHQVSIIAVCYSAAAIVSGIFFGSLSQKIGRRYTMILAALGSLVVVYFWAYAEGFMWLIITAAAMQFMVQGAWSVVPAYLNELAPAASRAVLPGFVYQIGNFVASADAPLQTAIAGGHNGNYSPALLIVAAVVAIIIVIFAFFGKESRDVEISTPES